MSSPQLLDHHKALLVERGITEQAAASRGYSSTMARGWLRQQGFSVAVSQLVPGLVIPVHDVHGDPAFIQYRPDTPRIRDGKPVKYETPHRARMVLDVPTSLNGKLGDPAVPLWVTESPLKADAAVSAGLACIATFGVYGWRGSNRRGGKTALPDFEYVALNGRTVYLVPDSDVATNHDVSLAISRLGGLLTSRGADVRYVYLPRPADGRKVGLDDYLAGGGSVDGLYELADDEPPERPAPTTSPPPAALPIQPVPLADAAATFTRWLHLDDHAPMLIAAAATVANTAPGDPVWVLIVGPPSGGKTEILSSCSTLPYIIKAATVTEAALLSGTSVKDRAKDATGGLLRQVGEFGIILCKDFTSVLSQNRDTARQAIAALREVYDGSWDRPIGGDGGRVLSWAGKCGLIGGVTPSYDRYGTIVNALGDRFVLLRMPDVQAERQALSALDNGRHEAQMRAELATAMTGLIAGANTSLVNADLDMQQRQQLVTLATFAATARTAVERDGYSGELLVMPQAEGPARLVKVLRRLYGGLLAIGVNDNTAWQLLHRIARDCAPAIRLPLMTALISANAPLRTSDLATRVGLVTKTAHRQLDDLVLLGIASHDKESSAGNAADMWWASDWLRKYWPTEAGQKCTTALSVSLKEDAVGAANAQPNDAHLGSPRTSLSRSARPGCAECQRRSAFNTGPCPTHQPKDAA